MDESVTAAEANRKFAALLRGVREGRTYVVTSHGKPVARIVPADKGEAATGQARAALFARLREQPVVVVGPWTRDELYDE